MKRFLQENNFHVIKLSIFLCEYVYYYAYICVIAHVCVNVCIYIYLYIVYWYEMDGNFLLYRKKIT